MRSTGGRAAQASIDLFYGEISVVWICSLSDTLVLVFTSAKTNTVVVIQTLEALQICFKVSELTEQRLERLEISADTVLQELAKLAFANMGDYLSVGADGSITVDVSRITPARGLRLPNGISRPGAVIDIIAVRQGAGQSSNVLS